MAKSKSKNKKKTKKNSNYKNEKIEYKVPPKKKNGKVMTEKQKLREHDKAEKKKRKMAEMSEKQNKKQSTTQNKNQNPAQKEVPKQKAKENNKGKIPEKVILQPEKDEKTGRIEAKESEVIFVPISGDFIRKNVDENNITQQQADEQISAAEQNEEIAKEFESDEQIGFPKEEVKDNENTVCIDEPGAEVMKKTDNSAEQIFDEVKEEINNINIPSQEESKVQENISNGQAEHNEKTKEKNNNRRSSAMSKPEIKEISIDELMEVQQQAEIEHKEKKAKINYKERAAYLRKKYAKKIKPVHYIVAAAILVVFMGLIYALIGMLNAAEPAAIRNINYTGRNQPQSTVISITSSEEDQKKLSKNTASKGSKKFDFFAYTEMTVDETDAPLSITLGNPSYNDCTLIATIINEKGETVYRTAGIEPGTYISSITLANTLVYGENKLTLYVTAFGGDGGKDGKTYSKFGTRSSELTIHVNNEYNDSMLTTKS